ncbi:hypothetical protein KEM52_000932 [Ascosphaera acerosa]|nr:hypothetical protein KEM52_000932 [Ascosphaera acerosa]
MITDDELYSIAIFLGVLAMFLIVLYHFLEVNSTNENSDTPTKPAKPAKPTKAASAAAR